MKKLAMAVVLLAVAGSASAQFFLGGGLGRSRSELRCSDLISCDASETGDTAYKFFGGYRFKTWLGVEGGYINFGEVKGQAAAPLVAARGAGSVKSDAFYAAAVFRLDLTDRLGAVGRVGSAAVRTRASLINNANGSELYSVSDSSLEPFVGLALEYSFSRLVRASVDVDMTRSAPVKYEGDTVLDSGLTRAMTLSVQYGF